jgi:lysine 2,3-aminomutase
MATFTFEKTYIPHGVSQEEWTDWSWQLRHSLKSAQEFSKVFSLSEEETKAFDQGEKVFNIRATPYYAALAKDIPQDPIRRILMPHAFELAAGSQQMLDPLGEKKNNPTSRIIHRYSDRVLFLITDICSVYCRYCTRKHFTGQEQAFIKKDEYAAAIEYIKSHPGIREVILSGGDPLTVSDQQLERVLSDLRAIPHIEIIRLGTRMPVVAPMRVTEKLVKMIRQYKPVFLMTHFNHPRELTAESAQALELFVDNGVPVMNQMVLLNGINNHPAIVQALSRRLLYLRVKPYYMFQCDPSEGTDHLRTSIEDSLEIQKELWGHLSGLAMPTLSVDIPDGGGKTYLVPNFEVSRTEKVRKYVGWDGVRAEYVNPPVENLVKPLDFEVYQAEWEMLKNAKN